MISYTCANCGLVSSREACRQCDAEDKSARAGAAQVEQLMAILLGQQVEKALRRRRRVARKNATPVVTGPAPTTESLGTTLRIRRNPMVVS